MNKEDKKVILQGENGEKYQEISASEWDKLNEGEREILINPTRLVRKLKERK